MTCPEHDFVPFPGSRRLLHCRFCGVGHDAFAKTERAPRRAAPPPRRPHPSSGQGQTEAPLLPGIVDADRDAAQEVIAARELERAVRSIVDEGGFPEDEAEQMIAEAVDFGPALDLENFAQQIVARSERRTPRFAPEEE